METPKLSIHQQYSFAIIITSIVFSKTHEESENDMPDPILDKSGNPYITHCLDVMHAVHRKYKDYELSAAAVMHDLVEDTICPDTKKPWTKQDLANLGFSERIIDIVFALTKHDNQTYDAYIDQVCEIYDAIKIKVADLEDNLREDRALPETPQNKDRLDKYKATYLDLKNMLDE